MTKYEEIREKHQKEVNEFPIGFAFSDQQFEEQMKKLGLEPNQTNEVVSIGGGGFIKKKDIENFEAMFKKHSDEIKEEIAKDKTGEGFIKEMFQFKLANYEFDYTHELEPTLEALNLTKKQIRENKALKNGLLLAINSIDTE